MSVAFAQDFQDGSRIQKLCNDNRYSKDCLSALLFFHGSAYDQRVHALGDLLDASIDLTQSMGIVSTTQDGVVEYVAFASELVFLMQQSFTIEFLSKLNVDLENALRHRNPFNLWRYTLIAVKGDTAKALWLLGVLLQDTSYHKVHLAYLVDLKHPKIEENSLTILSNVLDLLDPDQLEEEKYREWLSLYPPMKPFGAQQEFKSQMYHFYTISYAAMRLKWRTRKKSLAAFLPFLLDASYKFRQIDEARWPKHPKAFDREENESPMRDMYAAYLGCQWATGSSATLFQFKEFSEQMSANPLKFMQRLYAREINHR